MLNRYRAESLKPIKRLIAADRYSEAMNILLARRSSLLIALHQQDHDEAIEKIELVLTLVNCLMAECASKSGDPTEADAWFDTAFTYCLDSHDPVVHLRLRRVYSVHLADQGRLDEALVEIISVISDMRRLTSTETAIPANRRKVELAYSVGCQAKMLLNEDASSETGRKLALQSNTVLRRGTKRRYELRNLLLCLDSVSSVTHPIKWQRMIGRAMYLNEVYMHSNEIRVRLASMMVFAPVTDGLAIGRTVATYLPTAR